MQRHTMTEIVNHSRSTALERPVRDLLGSLIDFTRPESSPLELVVYTRHLFSPREGFLIHQCNISENIKIKLVRNCDSSV